MLRLLYASILIVFISISGRVSAQGTWIQAANFPDSARYSSVSITVGNKGYMFLGITTIFTKETWEYDHSTNMWTLKAPFPGSGRVRPFIFEINGDIYIGCGSNLNFTTCYNDVWKYSIASDTWTSMGTFPGNNIIGAATYNYNGKAYVSLGRSPCLGGINSQQTWTFDPVSATWAQLPDIALNYSWFYTEAGVINNKAIYVNSSNSKVFALDLITNTWDLNYPDADLYFNNNSLYESFVYNGNFYPVSHNYIRVFHEPSLRWLNSDTAYNADWHDSPALFVFGDTVKFVCGKDPFGSRSNHIWNFVIGCTSSITTDFSINDTSYFQSATSLNNLSVVNPAGFKYVYHWQADTIDIGWTTTDTSFLPVMYGTYNVEMIATNVYCSDTIVKQTYVLNSQWSPKTILPKEITPRTGCAVFTIGAEAYMGLGLDVNTKILKDFFKYNSNDHSIVKLNDFPDTLIRDFACETYNGKGYLIAGSNGTSPYKSNRFYEYDPTSDVWTRLPDFPGPARGFSNTFIIGGDLFLCLGGVASTYKYNFASTTWTPVAPQPVLTYAPAGLSYNGKGLIISANGAASSSIWQYDPVADSWSQLAANFMREQLSGCSFIIKGDKLWVLYGHDGGTLTFAYKNTSFFFDLITHETTDGPDNIAITGAYDGRTAAKVFYLNGYYYSCFGAGPGNWRDVTIARFQPGACFNLPHVYPTEIDEAGIGYQIPFSNRNFHYPPVNPAGFDMLIDGVIDITGMNQAYLQYAFENCGEHQISWVVNGIGCTDTFTYKMTAHPLYRPEPRAETPFGVTHIRHTVNALSINGKGYMGMGNKYVEILVEAYKDWYEYDPLTDSWTVKDTLPSTEKHTGSACFSDNTHGYITCGSKGCFPNGSCYLNDTWQYDPVADNWAMKTNLPANGRYRPKAGVVGNLAMTGLGYYPLSGVDNIYLYDMSNDTWSDANWPYGVGAEPTIFSYNGDFYAGYAGVGGSGNFEGLYKFNIADTSWSEQLLCNNDMSYGEHYIVDGDFIYTFGYNVNKIDLKKMKVIPFPPIAIPGDTSMEVSGGFNIGNKAYMSILNLDFGSPRLGNHFYEYDLNQPYCNYTDFVTSVNERKTAADGATVFPQPATKEVTIKLSNSKTTKHYFNLYDLQGKLVMSRTFFGNQYKMDVESLSGLYFADFPEENIHLKMLVEK